MNESTKEQREEFGKWWESQPMFEPLDERYITTQAVFDLWLFNREKDEEIAVLRANRKADEQTIADLTDQRDRAWEALQVAVDRHHQATMTTCNEPCWCWDSEIVLMQAEARGEAK